MPSNSNLNVKFGDKIGSGSTVPTSSAAASNTAGNIYAAKNSLDEIEMYIDTPIDTTHSTTARKRLDPRIYVGSLPSGKSTTDIWSNYDVWIDTSGDPTGVATTTADGLMSSTNVNDINTLKTQMSAANTNISNIKTKINNLITALQGLNIEIKKGPWNSETMGGEKTLTILMPSSWAGTEVTFNPDGGQGALS